MKIDKTIYQIAQMAIGNDSMRGQIQEEFDMSDDEIIEVYEYLNRIIPKFTKLGY